MKFHHKYTRHLDIDKVAISLLIVATLLSGGILASTRAKADASDTTVVDEISVVIPVSCSMLGTVTSAHTDTVTAVSYTEDIGVTDLKATCNDFNGFSIYAIGFTGNTEGTTTMVGANSGLTISTSVHHDGDTASSWAMKLTKVTNPGGGEPDITYNPDILSITNGYSSYNVVPSSLTQVVEYKDNNGGSSVTDQTLGAHVQTTYAAYVSGSQAADTYTGQVKYVLVHPANFATGKYSIVYNANGGAGTMASESNIPNYEPHIIPTSTITPPSGYIFAGWCTVRDQTQNPQTTCAGDSYADQGTIPASTVATGNPTPTLNLYAYWKVFPTINDLSYMQDFATLSSEEKTSVLNSMTTGVQYQLKDIRGDQKEYYISKLADGNVWMTQNLDLDLIAGTTFTHSDTDLGWTTSDTEATWTVGEGYSTIPWDPIAGKFTGWDIQNALPYSADPGEKYYYTSNTTNNDTTFNSMTQCLEAGHTQADCEHYSAGNYYNWTAAVAGNVVNSGNAPDSICPAGWRLPKTSADEFANLLVAHNVIPNISSTSYVTDGSNVKIGFNTIRNYPLYFVRSGSVDNGTLILAASYGYYWSSTVYNASDARHLNFGSSNVYPASYNSRNYGWSVRCMAR